MRALDLGDVALRLRIRDLGPVVVQAGASVIELGLTKQAALLSLLAARANQRVPADDLVATAWGMDVEVSLSSLDSQLWRLRNTLEPHRKRTSSLLVRDGGGYRLNVSTDEVDSLRFELLAAAATSRTRTGDSSANLVAFDQALALWRDEPFDAVLDTTATAAIAARWQELRDQLFEYRIDALLDLGAPDRALLDLEPQIARTPLREHLWWQRMIALARLDRADEALATYRRVAELLADELGLDPGSELRQLQARILARDPTLASRTQQDLSVVTDALPATVPGPATGRPASPHASAVRLPRRGARLIGREADLTRLVTLLERQPLVTITGTGGSGKTRLAVEVAATLAAQFPDGVWFVDLTTVSEPHLVIDVVVTTLALGASQVVDPLRALSDFAANKRILLVLDNCEHVLDGVAEVVEELLLGESDGRRASVLATSREPIGIDGEQIWSISSLSLLSGRNDVRQNANGTDDAPAVRLFVERAQAADPELELDPDALAVIARICRSLDGLPLAIELAAARVRSFSLAEIAEQAQADPSRLSRIGRPRADHRQSLYDAIQWSYRLLPAREQALHRRLSVLPGAFTVAAARGVAGDVGLDEYEVTELLLGLAHRSLLDARDGTGVRSAPRFAQLDTVRAHAHRQLLAEGESADTVRRRDRWVAALLARRPRLGRPEAPAWYDEVEASYPIVRAALQRAVGPDGDEELVGLGSSLGFFWFFRSRLIEGCRWLEAAQASGRESPGSIDDLLTRLRLAGALMLRFRPDLARTQLDVAVERLGDVPESSRIVVAEALVSAAGGAWAGTAYDQLARLSAALTDLAAGTDDQVVRLFAEIVSCIAMLPLGRLEEAGERVGQLYARAVELDNVVAAWLSSLAGCVVASESLRANEALDWTRRVLRLNQRLGTGGSKAFLETVGNCLALTKDYDRAVRLYAAACAHARQAGSGWPEHPRTRELYERTRAALGPDEFDEAWRESEYLSIGDLTSLYLTSPDLTSPDL